MSSIVVDVSASLAVACREKGMETVLAVPAEAIVSAVNQEEVVSNHSRRKLPLIETCNS